MDDIVPPPGWQKPKKTNSQPMRNLRLRDQSPAGAKGRPSDTKAVPAPKLAGHPQPDTIEINEVDLEAKPKVAKHRRLNFDWWRRLNRNLRFGIIAIALLLFGAGAFIFYVHLHAKGGVSYSFTEHKPKKPTTVASPLTGVQVAPALAARPVTGIMMENSDYARPQSGLQDAGVVVEAIAEGGITRFLALFQDSTPQYIGPVRSLRPYYIDFAAPFQAGIVHVGGSPDALSEVRSGIYRDLDQFFNGSYFTRVTARDAPHNVYTSFAELDQLNQSKGYNSSTFTSWPRKADKKLATPTAKTIDFAISSPDFYAHYDYDATTNTYMRSEGGAAHLDLVSAADKTGVQLHPKVVIALVMGYSIATDGQHSVYSDTGSGATYVFQDGGVTVGQWNKTDTSSQIQFTDSSGKPLKLNAGQTWLSLVDDAGKITYKP